MYNHNTARVLSLPWCPSLIILPTRFKLFFIWRFFDLDIVMATTSAVTSSWLTWTASRPSHGGWRWSRWCLCGKVWFFICEVSCEVKTGDVRESIIKKLHPLITSDVSKVKSSAGDKPKWHFYHMWSQAQYLFSRILITMHFLKGLCMNYMHILY